MSIDKEIEKILNIYTTDKFYEDLKQAKEIFMAKTGKIDEEAYEYESRMNSFNDWYLFNYRKPDGTTIIDHYIANNNISEKLKEALLSTTYSLLHFSKINFRKQIVIKDVLHSLKYFLSRETVNLGLVEDDVFVGRILVYDDRPHLLNGICTLPREILSALKKESKKIRKLNNSEEEEVFLLNLERLKTRSIQYGHIDSSKIFTF
ncbi:MAG: hypothetical protein CME66_13835 [Halobacteriovoraceae bacterium]|jgi:hypothetical protein|nr:hypothetical protein [Halobacteriovoraceae bacterium]